MTETRRVLVVFLASPGDLADERRYAKACADEWNFVNSERTGWTVDLIGWEDTLPQAGRPQEVINKDVRRCAIFVGMMWRKWGSETGAGYSSGFHEEYSIATDLYEKTRRPQIAMFFKTVESTDDAGPELARVLAFRSKTISEHRVLFKDIQETDWPYSFRTSLHRLINSYIDEYSLDEQASSEEPQGISDAAPVSVSPQLPVNRIDIAKIISNEIASHSEESKVPRSTLARLRLLALGWRRGGLTETYLGIHEAHLIYKELRDTPLSTIECYGLIDAALNHPFGSTPLWAWVAKGGDDIDYIDLTALYQAEEKPAVGAFETLVRIGKRLNDDYSERLKKGFGALKRDVKIAALRYLSALGTTEDVPVIQKEFQKGDSSTSTPAADAIMAILLRSSAEKAVQFVADDDAAISSAAKVVISAKLPQVSTVTLIKLMTHRDAELRIEALRVLTLRPDAPASDLAAYRSDPSPKVRLQAVLTAEQRGEEITESDAKGIIVRPGTKNVFASGRTTRDEGEEEFSQWKMMRLALASNAELLSTMNQFYSPAEKAYQIYVSRNFKTEADRLRNDIRDNFAQYFETTKESYRAKFGTNASIIIDSFSELATWRTSEMMRVGLDVLAARTNGSDLPLIRELLSDGRGKLSIPVLNYLKKYGEWDDIRLIDDSFSRHGAASMASVASTIRGTAVSTILHLARGRAADLLKLELSPILLAGTLRQIGKTAFETLSDGDIAASLNHPDLEVRKAAAGKAVASLKKARIYALLDQYLAQKTYFYNVVYWLDAGIDCPPKYLRPMLQSEFTPA